MAVVPLIISCRAPSRGRLPLFSFCPSLLSSSSLITHHVSCWGLCSWCLPSSSCSWNPVSIVLFPSSAQSRLMLKLQSPSSLADGSSTESHWRIIGRLISPTRTSGTSQLIFGREGLWLSFLIQFLPSTGSTPPPYLTNADMHTHELSCHDDSTIRIQKQLNVYNNCIPSG